MCNLLTQRDVQWPQQSGPKDEGRASGKPRSHAALAGSGSLCGVHALRGAPAGRRANEAPWCAFVAAIPERHTNGLNPAKLIRNTRSQRKRV